MLKVLSHGVQITTGSAIMIFIRYNLAPISICAKYVLSHGVQYTTGSAIMIFIRYNLDPISICAKYVYFAYCF